MSWLFGRAERGDPRATAIFLARSQDQRRQKLHEQFAHEIEDLSTEMLKIFKEENEDIEREHRNRAREKREREWENEQLEHARKQNLLREEETKDSKTLARELQLINAVKTGSLSLVKSLFFMIDDLDPMKCPKKKKK